MIRLWLMIALTRLGAEMQWRADRLGHLTTDPMCVEHRKMPRAGSRLDLASRGLACGECMADRAWGRSGDVLGRVPDAIRERAWSDMDAATTAAAASRVLGTNDPSQLDRS